MTNADERSADAERKKLAELLDRGLDSIDSGRIVSKEEMRRRLEAIRKEPLPKPGRQRKSG